MLHWPQRPLALLFILLCSTSVVRAGDFSDLGRAVAIKDWGAANKYAAVLDRQDGGQFFAAYVAAAGMVSNNQCTEARPALAALVAAKPYFVPAHDLAYVCAEAAGDTRGAISQLQAMLAVVPDGPQHDLLAQLLRQTQARSHPAIEVHGGIAPSSNVNRATGANTLPGSNWTILERATPGVLANGGTSATVDLFERPGFAAAGLIGADLGYSTATGLLSPTFSTALPMTFGSLGTLQLSVAPFAATNLNGLVFGSEHIGVRTSAAQPLPAGTIALDGVVSYGTYPDWTGHDGIEAAGSLSTSWLLDPSTQLSGRLSAAYDHTFDDTWRTLDVSALMRVDRLLPEGFLVSLQAETGARLHATPPPMLPPGAPNQLDVHAAVRLELGNRNLAIGPFIPVLYYQYQVQHSDNVFFAWEAHDVGIGLRTKF